MARSKKEKVDLITMAMEMIAEDGWRRFSMAALARRGHIGLDELYRQYAGPGAILAALGRRLDEDMLAGDVSGLDELDVRERLFDILMRRFEAMQPYRPAFAAMAREAARDPSLSLRALCNLDRMAARVADAAGIRLHGLAGKAARASLVLAYTRAFRTWLGDESGDMAATMAELDRRLAGLERAAGLACRLRRRRSEAQPVAA
ncbi:MAG: hypothetical protein R3C97_04085 [Geminicoccaceae bacterium]